MAQDQSAGDPHELQVRHTSDAEELQEARHELWSHALGYIKSMALKCALDLGIPDTIQRCGGAATLREILAASDVPAPSLPYLRRLMRTLTTLRVFKLSHDPSSNDHADADAAAADVSYELTPTSRLLLRLGDPSYFSLFPTIYPLVQQGTVSPMFIMGDWMKQQHHAPAMSLYEMVHGKSVWEGLQGSATLRAGFYDSMDADTRLVMHAVVSESPGVFHGLTSLVDVGGGRGTAAAAIASAFPHIQCTVMDLPEVVADAPAGTGLCFLGGDMFEHIPQADALLLKWILHDWDDAMCIKIMHRCKEAISGKEGRGKVIIIDMVIGSKPNDGMMCKETHVLCDLYMMAVSNGAEREECEWRRIFLAAGFRDYKITHISCIPYIIEVYL